jgi:DNA-binding transcriptional MerR regulator
MSTTDLLRISQAADLMSVSSKTLRNWDKDGSFKPWARTGNQRRYTRQQIKDWFDSRTKVQLTSDGVPMSEEQRVYQMWNHTGLLKGLDETKGFQMAIILENQRRHNEANPYLSPDFRRCSIPICRRIGPMLYSADPEIAISTKLTTEAELIEVFEGYRRFWRPTMKDRFKTGLKDNIVDEEATRVASMANQLLMDLNDLILKCNASEFHFYCISITDDEDLVVHFGLTK